MTDFSLADLARIVTTRARSGDPGSYTAKLVGAGVERTAKKFGEEAVEAALAAVAGSEAALTAEAADVLYHLLVMLEAPEGGAQRVMIVGVLGTQLYRLAADGRRLGEPVGAQQRPAEDEVVVGVVR